MALLFVELDAQESRNCHQGASSSTKSTTAVHVVAEKGNLSCLEFLLSQADADVEVEDGVRQLRIKAFLKLAQFSRVHPRRSKTRRWLSLRLRTSSTL